MHASDPFAALVAVGWPPAQPWPVLDAGQRVARVAAQHRAGYVLHDGRESFKAQPAPGFLRRSLTPEQRPVVGDFVILADGRPPHIVEIPPRRSLLSRRAQRPATAMAPGSMPDAVGSVRRSPLSASFNP